MARAFVERGGDLGEFLLRLLEQPLGLLFLLLGDLTRRTLFELVISPQFFLLGITLAGDLRCKLGPLLIELGPLGCSLGFDPGQGVGIFLRERCDCGGLLLPGGRGGGLLFIVGRPHGHLVVRADRLFPGGPLGSGLAENNHLSTEESGVVGAGIHRQNKFHEGGQEGAWQSIKQRSPTISVHRYHWHPGWPARAPQPDGQRPRAFA